MYTAYGLIVRQSRTASLKLHRDTMGGGGSFVAAIRSTSISFVRYNSVIFSLALKRRFLDYNTITKHATIFGVIILPQVKNSTCSCNTRAHTCIRYLPPLSLAHSLLSLSLAHSHHLTLIVSRLFVFVFSLFFSFVPFYKVTFYLGPEKV